MCNQDSIVINSHLVTDRTGPEECSLSIITDRSVRHCTWAVKINCLTDGRIQVKHSLIVLSYNVPPQPKIGISESADLAAD